MYGVHLVVYRTAVRVMPIGVVDSRSMMDPTRKSTARDAIGHFVHGDGGAWPLLSVPRR